MARDIRLKQRWELLVNKLSAKFSDGDPLELDGIIYLVGIQELGQVHRKFKKDEKVNLMHIAICRLLCKLSFLLLPSSQRIAIALPFVDNQPTALPLHCHLSTIDPPHCHCHFCAAELFGNNINISIHHVKWIISG